MARVPTPANIVPQIIVVGPPFKKAEPIVKLIPVHEDKTVMPNATAGFNERYRFLGRSASPMLQVHWNVPYVELLR